MMTIQSTLWIAYRDGGDMSARDSLIEESLGLVMHLAKQIGGSFADEEMNNHLVSAGNIGLMKAVDDFNPDLGHAFSTFACPRIRGAMLDDMRARDPLSRVARKRAKAFAIAERAVRTRVNRSPSALEIATELGVDSDTYWSWKLDLDFDTSVPLDQRTPGVLSADERIAGPDDTSESIEREERVALVKEALLELTDQERTVVSLYYYEGLKGREIGSVLNVTEGRISQIRTSAISKLRVSMSPVEAYGFDVGCVLAA